MTATVGTEERAALPGWRFSSLWHLIYLAYMFVPLVFEPRVRPLAWAASAAALALFVPIYVLAEMRPGRVRRWSAAMTTALAVLVFPLNSGSSILLVYAAGGAAAGLPRRTALRAMTGLSVVALIGAALSPIPLAFRFLTFGPVLVFIWVIGIQVLDEIARDRAQADLRVENARIQHLATLAERERISRDLHDLLGQALTGIVVRAQLAQRLAAVDARRSTAETAEIEQVARNALAEVRATVAGMRQVSLDDEVEVAREALAAAGVALTVTRDPAVTLAPTTENALALAVREAVTNIVRHAHARSATIALHESGGRVVLEVADDGVGGDRADGGGLAGMRERVAALGGEVARRVQHGTSVTVAVPATAAAT